MFIPQKARQWSGQAQGVAPFDGVNHRYLLLMDQVVVKPPDAVQMAVDGFGSQPSIQQMINIAQQDLMRHLFDGDIGGGPQKLDNVLSYKSDQIIWRI